MTSYAQLIRACSPITLAEQSSLPLPDEISLQSLCFNGQFGRSFTDVDGNTIRIRQFGFWNHAAGPDFQHCSIEINGEQFNGDIELDTNTLDWENHQHHINPNYNNVVLHIVFQDTASTYFTRSENHSAIPRVVVPHSIVQQALQQPRYAVADSTIGRCHAPLLHCSETQILQVLEQAAQHRCKLKAQRFQATLKAHTYSQALWTAIASTLGYHNNQSAMLTLAQRVPISQMIEHPEWADSLLFGVAGFLTAESFKNAPKPTQEWMNQLWENWWKLRSKHELSPQRAIRWTHTGNRPSNHPQRRIAALAALAKNWNVVLSLSASPDALCKYITQLTDPFWSHHHTLASKTSSHKLALIGKQRANDLLINYLLPHAMVAQQSSSAASHYKKIPAPPVSNSIKRVSYRLFGNRQDTSTFLKKSWQHQALLQIYHDFCLDDTSDCSECPFPEQLQQHLC